MTIPISFIGTCKKLTIVSNDMCFGPCPAPDDEIEQHLTITADGRVFFSAYTYGNGIKHLKSRTKNFKIAPDKASYIVKIIADYFSDDYDEVMATDVGDWKMTLTNEEGVSYCFRGSLCSGASKKLDDFSDIIRLNLNMPELFAFDGCAYSERIEKISIDYHRITKTEPGFIPEGAKRKDVSWDCREHLIIDRKTGTLEYTRNIGSGCQIVRKYHVEDGILSLLNDLDVENFFADTEVNPSDVANNFLETKDYKITIDYLYREQRVLTGTFDKRCVPDDFIDFAKAVYEFMNFYGMGEIFDLSVHDKALRQQNELIFCNVKFDECGKTYYYLTDDETLEAGDRVLVPVGEDNHESTARIESVEYHAAEEAPFSAQRIKKIISKANDE